MNKQEFLDALQGGLSGLPEEDLQRILDFYSEIIDDCVEDGLSQEKAVATLDSVDEILASLQMESPHHTASQPQTQTITGPSAVTQVRQPFSSMSITASDCTIRLFPATDGVCRVSYRHPSQVGLSIRGPRHPGHPTTGQAQLAGTPAGQLGRRRNRALSPRHSVPEFEHPYRQRVCGNSQRFHLLSHPSSRGQRQRTLLLWGKGAAGTQGGQRKAVGGGTEQP